MVVQDQQGPSAYIPLWIAAGVFLALAVLWAGGWKLHAWYARRSARPEHVDSDFSVRLLPPSDPYYSSRFSLLSHRLPG